MTDAGKDGKFLLLIVPLLLSAKYRGDFGRFVAGYIFVVWILQCCWWRKRRAAAPQDVKNEDEE